MMGAGKKQEWVGKKNDLCWFFGWFVLAEGHHHCWASSFQYQAFREWSIILLRARRHQRGAGSLHMSTCSHSRGQSLVQTTLRAGFDPCRSHALQSWPRWLSWVPSSSQYSVKSTHYFFNLNQQTNAKSSTSCLSFPNDSGYISIFSTFFGCKTGEHRGMHQFIGSAKAAIKENPQTHEKPQFWLAMFP